jgi:hypothetical protein
MSFEWKIQKMFLLVEFRSFYAEENLLYNNSCRKIKFKILAAY